MIFPQFKKKRLKRKISPEASPLFNKKSVNFLTWAKRFFPFRECHLGKNSACYHMSSNSCFLIFFVDNSSNLAFTLGVIQRFSAIFYNASGTSVVIGCTWRMLTNVDLDYKNLYKRNATLTSGAEIRTFRRWHRQPKPPTQPQPSFDLDRPQPGLRGPQLEDAAKTWTQKNRQKKNVSDQIN